MAGSDGAKHVLVVNDTEEVVELFRDILEGLGHRCSSISYAPQDLSEVASIKPDLVIVDVLIDGEKHGWQLAQKMRMSRETEAIPIIICTALTNDVREQEGWLVSKAIKVVPKPFSVDELELAVTKALQVPGPVA